jgi:hypothetical protein
MKKLLLVITVFACAIKVNAGGLSISKQPKDTTVCLSSAASFTVNAVSGDILVYKWQINRGSGFTDISGSAYSGLSTQTLSINTVVDSLKTFKFRCVVNDTIGDTLTTNLCGFSIPAAINKISQTDYKIYCNQLTDTMSINATGVLSYQWKWDTGSGYVNMTNNADYSGTQTAALILKNPNPNMHNYKYKCILTSACGIKDSSNVINFTGITTCYFSGDPTDVSMCSSSGVSKQFYCNMYGPHFSAKWQVDSAGTGFKDIDANDPRYIGPHTGNVLPIAGNPPSYLDGNKYRCVMISICNEEIFSGEAKLTVGSVTIPITKQPKSITALVAADATFSISHSGSNVSYQWQVNKGSGYSDVADDATYSGATKSVLKITAVTSGMNGYLYKCKLSNGCASAVTSSAVTLTTFDFKICMVTIENEKNQIIFQKPSNMTTVDSFFIYREGIVTDQFDLIGKLVSTDYSAFSDLTSNPRQQAEIYKMAIKFKDGSVSTMTSPHTTMLLTTNRGVNNSTWNLIWNKYQGISVATYQIYRGIDSTSLTYLASVSGSNSIFTDNAAPVGDIYYQIVILGTTCTPAQGGPIPGQAPVPQLLGGSFTEIKSNINRTKDTSAIVTGITELSQWSDLKVYPNPTSGSVVLQISSDANFAAAVSVYDLLGQKVLNENVKIANGQNQISLSTNALSNGMYLVQISSASTQSVTTLVVQK